MTSKHTLVTQTEAIVRERMNSQAAGHGFDHVQRVWRLSREIQAEAGGELLVIELAALLHDLGDAKFNEGVERSAEFASEILTELGAASETADHVAHIVDLAHIPTTQILIECIGVLKHAVHIADLADGGGIHELCRSVLCPKLSGRRCNR